ncbi:MAG: 50S ribosomal protein L10 [Candidatus Syntrophonatronum acetioxidans]|uniref:Large ribosomal subunit protein uL10 n=1 Tax=Candidatus Syntrophonatronum acetioxidans TaxID=1795816 RepID=A0A424YG36_9FIRM|nr:MAG: 50S ribosomal protein L10 [Candidatus Syntrophonatronum acetioxidans]
MGVREDKKRTVAELKEKMEGSRALVLADYRGLNVSEISDLRKRLSEEGIEFKVVKNTLTRIAASEAGYDELNTYLEGPTAIAFSQDDPVAPAKVLSNFAKENDKLKIKCGLLRGILISFADIKAIAELPPREVLLGKVVGGMQAPVYGMAYAMQGLLSKTVYALQAIVDQKQGA